MSCKFMYVLETLGWKSLWQHRYESADLSQIVRVGTYSTYHTTPSSRRPHSDLTQTSLRPLSDLVQGE